MATVEVNADVKVIPAKRTATYDVPLDPDMAHLSKKLVGKVNAGAIVLVVGSGKIEMPKTLAAMDALGALVVALRDELLLQDVEL